MINLQQVSLYLLQISITQSKLDHYGTRGHELKLTQNFLANRSQQVVVEGHTPVPALVTSGITLGTPWGLFCTSYTLKESSNTRLFADDSLLYRRIMSSEDTRILQEDLEDYKPGKRNDRCQSILQNVSSSE